MGKVLVARIKEKGRTGKGCFEYKNEIPLDDFKRVALFLFDLSSYGANIEKAFKEFQERSEEEDFPW